MVDLPSGKMKSREGTVVDADELMDEMFATAEQHTRELGKIEGLTEEQAQGLYKMLGLGALKYFLLKVDPKKRMLFDPQESIEFHGNTGPFIQYTHARIAAILRRADQEKIKGMVDTMALSQQEPRELNLIYHLGRYTTVIEQSASEYSPALLAQYVYDLAKEYNGFYQEISIFGDADQVKTSFRIALSEVTEKVISHGMGLMGIDVPDRM
jgi:arginyl-tRNA synthetase